MNKVRSKAKFGELIVGAGIITQLQLDRALAIQREEDGVRNIGDILVSLKLCCQMDVDYILGVQAKLRNGGCDVEEMVAEPSHEDADFQEIGSLASSITRRAK